MTTTIQFSWSRQEGIGLILASLSIGLFAQIPPIYFALVFLSFNFQEYFISIIGTLIGITIIIATISCSIAEDWFPSIIPSLKTVMSSAIIITLLFSGGFFLFFVLQPFFPTEFAELDATQSYFLAITLGLALVGITTAFIYKARSFFKK